MEIIESLRFRRDNQLPTPPELVTRALKAAGDSTAIRAEYHDRITDALIGYLEGRSMQAAKGKFKRATSDAFNDAFDLGWVDGGQDMPVDDDANGWIGARMTEEFGHIDMLFQAAKELKKDEDFEPFAWASQRADGYAATLASIYNAGRMWAQKNKMLKWHLGKTEKHCDTCAKLDRDKPHRASWYIARDYIPRKPGAAMDCHGYHCDCSLTDKNGNEVTL